MSANVQQTTRQNAALSIQADPAELFLQEVTIGVRQLKPDSEERYKNIEQSASQTATAVLFNTPEQDLLLVKPQYASGAFGNCSVWIGAKDKRLYIRKIIVGDIASTSINSSIESEVALTVDHPNVPKIRYHVNHGGGPHPNVFGHKDFSGEQIKTVWSIVSDFVNGPTLEHFTRRSGEKLPEGAIWKCGLTLLKVLQKMQLQNIVHSDIKSRNILISAETTSTGREEAEFHLIDFGLAQQIHVPVGNSYRDCSLIAEVLFCMILNKPTSGGFRTCRKLYREVQEVAKQTEWTYSQDLVNATWNLHEFEMRQNKRHGIAIPLERMQKWQERFEKGLDLCRGLEPQAGRCDTLEIEIPIQDTRPLLVENAFQLTRSSSTACCPFRKAKININTLEVWEIGAFDVWGEHFTDVCWKSD